MKTSLTIIFVFSLISTLFSQEDVIQNIKDHYYTINEDNYLYHDLEMNFIFAAIGDQTKKVRFYFVSEQADPENDPYEMNNYLLKAEINFNISASVYFTIEYLYDLSGKLMFFYEKKEGYESSEKRYYFTNNKLIKCIIKDNTNENTQINYTSTDNFKESDIEFSRNILKRSYGYKELFKQLNIGADID